MMEKDECFTDNSKFNRCVACKNCIYSKRFYKKGGGGDLIPGDRPYESGSCQIYYGKPTDVYFYEADCKYRKEE